MMKTAETFSLHINLYRKHTDGQAHILIWPAGHVPIVIYRPPPVNANVDSVNVDAALYASTQLQTHIAAF